MSDKIVLPKSSINKIDKIDKMLNMQDKGRALNYCIDLAEKLVTQMNKGGSVFYETKKGRSFEIIMPGES